MGGGVGCKRGVRGVGDKGGVGIWDKGVYRGVGGVRDKV